ncbi:MAG: hypothetical protein DMG57_06625 [Acidobacteria bacterium]|nr:MAG: hypothetical protein DMG57_06625 [Acidobacteriota bacterium]
MATVFEVVTAGKVYHVAGRALQRWIVERRQKWNGPKGYMFSSARAWNESQLDWQCPAPSDRPAVKLMEYRIIQ